MEKINKDGTKDNQIACACGIEKKCCKCCKCCKFDSKKSCNK